MELFQFIKVMFEDSQTYDTVASNEKKKHYFMVNKRMSIMFPLQAQELQHVKADDVAVVDFWQSFVRKSYNKVPGWMYTRGTKKSKETIEKSNIGHKTIDEFASLHGCDTKVIREALDFFPEDMNKELKEFEKIKKIKTDNN